jgi:hypothetical protein
MQTITIPKREYVNLLLIAGKYLAELEKYPSMNANAIREARALLAAFDEESE